MVLVAALLEGRAGREQRLASVGLVDGKSAERIARAGCSGEKFGRRDIGEGGLRGSTGGRRVGDEGPAVPVAGEVELARHIVAEEGQLGGVKTGGNTERAAGMEIGRASCRERV